MGTIVDKLTAVLASKKEMKQAIIDKGVDCNDVLSTYADNILAIPSIAYGFVNITTATNQSSSDDIIGKTISVAYGDITTSLTIDGSVLVTKIPQYATYTITYPSVDGYKTPASVVGTAMAGVADDVTATYETEVVSVTLSCEDGTSVVGQVVTINGVDYTWDGTAISAKIPFGAEYAVSVNDLAGYNAPTSVTYTASQATRSIAMVYEAVKLGVYILDTDGKLTTSDKWDSANNDKVVGIAVLTDACKFILATEQAGKYWSSSSSTISGVTTTTSSATAQADYNGVSNTDAIISATGSTTNYAAGYCRAYEFADGREGYLGAAGEIYTMIANMTEVNNCLTAVSGTAISDSDYLHTSTQYNSSYAWRVYASTGALSRTSKTSNTRKVRPIAKYE